MKTFMKCLVTLALALSALAAMATGAMASRGISLGQALTVTATGQTTLTTNGVSVICRLNITLTINASILKSADATADGSVPTATITNCNDGSTGRVTSVIPLFYTSWAGSLPSNITAINARTGTAAFTMSDGILFPPSPGGCAYTASSLTVQLSGAASVITTGRFSGTATAASPCPTPATIASSPFVLTSLTSGVRLTLV